jgi:hypothetical protein
MKIATVASASREQVHESERIACGHMSRARQIRISMIQSAADGTGSLLPPSARRSIPDPVN